jgi:hypothetical protein
VLRIGGRLASVVIEPAVGLGEAGMARARMLGPGNLTTSGRLAHHVEAAGLAVVSEEDWTGELASLLRALLEGLRSEEDMLRAAEGDEVYEHEFEKKHSLLTGVEEGLLVRTFVLAAR